MQQKPEENIKNTQTTEHEIEALTSGKRRRKGPAERIWAPYRLRFHKNYHYISNNIGLKFLYLIAVFVGMPFGYLVFKLRWKFKIRNKKNIKLIKHTSAITVANHAHNMDSPMMTAAFYPNFPYFVALPHNFEAFIVGGLVRVLRGIPLPSDIKDLENFTKQIDNLLQTTTHKVHFYPEGEIDPYSRELRKFKNGAFHFAIKNGVPVFPMAFVFPKKNHVELLLGEPIYLKDIPNADGQKEAKQAVMMSRFTYEKMKNMMEEYYGGLNEN